MALEDNWLKDNFINLKEIPQDGQGIKLSAAQRKKMKKGKNYAVLFIESIWWTNSHVQGRVVFLSQAGDLGQDA